MKSPTHGGLHHVELWVPDIDRAVVSLGWLLEHLGYQPHHNWGAGRSWRLGPVYLVVEQSPAMSRVAHDRMSPGLNHLAFHVQDNIELDKLVGESTDFGWRLMFADRHPYAGGDEHYAAYLENQDGFEVELVAITVV